MRKISRKGIIKKLDALVTKITLAREPVDVMDGSSVQLGVGHIFSRKHLATRWDVTPDGNCHTQAWANNYRHVYNTYPYNTWYIKKFGQKKFDELYQRWNKVTKISTAELVELYTRLS